MRKKLHFEILDTKRRGIFERLAKIAPNNSYLAGGTALALQIGHRESLDFDLFCPKEITFAVKKKVLKEFSDFSLQTLVDTSDELSLVLDGEIKITLLNYFWSPVRPLVKVTKAVPLLSIPDIAAAKAYALGRRGNFRDYFDLYVLVKNGHATLKDIVKLCRRKYGEVFSERMFLEQLTYMGDSSGDKQLRYLGEKFVSPAQLIEFFKKEISKNV
ncbi:MAG: nucleotidyl transferase AbiEii/AbiGii toxin family protein [bacterium]